MRRLANRPLIGYLIGMVVVVLGFWRIETIARNIEDESKARVKAQCEAGNQGRAATRQAFLDFVEVLIAAASTDDRTPEEQKSYEIAVANFRQGTRERLRVTLAPRNCTRISEGAIDTAPLWEQAVQFFRETIGLDDDVDSSVSDREPKDSLDDRDFTASGESSRNGQEGGDRSNPPPAPSPNPQPPPEPSTPPPQQPPPSRPPDEEPGLLCRVLPPAEGVLPLLCELL